MEQKESFYTKFWVTWAFITVLYLFVTGFSLPGNAVFGVIGLFVPFGFWNLVSVSQGAFGWLAIVPLGFSILAADTIARKIGITRVSSKIIFNLVLLFLLTLLADFLIWGSWKSICFTGLPFPAVNCHFGT